MFDEQVNADFERARQKAFLRDLMSLFGRRRNDLIPYHEIRQRLSPERESYRGLQQVPIDKIVGSMDRFNDFDRAFLPRQAHTARRWKSVDRAFYQDVTLLPSSSTRWERSTSSRTATTESPSPASAAASSSTPR